MKHVFQLSFLMLFSYYSFAHVKLPKIFGDHMVLQRNKTIPVWGWADANEKITVKFNHQIKDTRADKSGHWMIRLDNESAGGPYQLQITGKNAIIFTDILVGEVWICSGQSNMEFLVSSAMSAEKDIANANYPLIHHFKVPKNISSVPQSDLTTGDWVVCSPETVGDFTAVGYFFARELYKELKIPIGLINTTWGGINSESWTSREAFEKSDEYKNMISSLPSLNLDSLALVQTGMMKKKIEKLQGSFDKYSDVESWKNLSYDDSRWPQMTLPSLWEQKGLEGLDGLVWFRKAITVLAEDAGKKGTLELSMIDDNDITYVNGVKVGSTNSWNAKRKYSIPAGVLRAGKNVITVRVEDTGGGGGIYGDPADMKLTIDDKVQPLAGDWLFKVESLLRGGSGTEPNDYPSLLFNAMVNPLIPYAIEGVIWYQGEANAERAYQYRKEFPLMISDWRHHWNQGNFPFYFVQLASFNAANGNSIHGSTWAELREAQQMALSLPNTGMSVTTDIGEPNDIHPKNKQDVGKRLAAIALHNVYKKEIVSGGPVYQSMKVAANKIVISFTGIGSGLIANDKYGYLKGFEIAGKDQQFHYAKAIIEGDKIIVWSDTVSTPEAVRFGWADDASEDNLFNKEGFPGAPFRTDQWKGITEGKKYEYKKW